MTKLTIEKLRKRIQDTGFDHLPLTKLEFGEIIHIVDEGEIKWMKMPIKIKSPEEIRDGLI